MRFQWKNIAYWQRRRQCVYDVSHFLWPARLRLRQTRNGLEKSGEKKAGDTAQAKRKVIRGERGKETPIELCDVKEHRFSGFLPRRSRVFDIEKWKELPYPLAAPDVGGSPLLPQREARGIKREERAKRKRSSYFVDASACRASGDSQTVPPLTTMCVPLFSLPLSLSLSRPSSSRRVATRRSLPFAWSTTVDFVGALSISDR